MKKLCLILTLVLLCTLAVFSVSAQEPALPEVCQHCGVAVTWTPLSAAQIRETVELTTGHYYVAMEEDIYDSVAKKIQKDQNVCLYLNGKTIAGTTRGFYVYEGGTLNIMGEGTFTGRGTTAGLEGACGYVEAGGTLNQYGGTLAYVVYKERHATSGGVLYVAGQYNLYGGTVENGIAKVYNGGNICIASGGEFHMYGGTVKGGSANNVGGNIYNHAKGICDLRSGRIEGGTAAVAGSDIYNRGALNLTGDAVCGEIYLNTDTANGGPALGDMLSITGDFAGNVGIRVNAAAPGLDVGNATGAINGKLSVVGAMLGAQVVDGHILLAANAYCDHCQKTVSWQQLDKSATRLTTGHYYTEYDIPDFAVKNLYVGDKVCINLNGKTVNGTTRAFCVYPGGELSIMGGGTLTGFGGTEKTPNGGTINLLKGGTVNLYSGTLTQQVDEASGLSAANGGVVNIGGVFRMYGGEIRDGVATNAGGSVFVETTGVLNVSGGVIGFGKMGASGSKSCVYNRGRVILSGSAQIADLLQKPNVEKGGPALGEMLSFEGGFTGSVVINCALPAGTDFGTLTGDISQGTVTLKKNMDLVATRIGNDLVSMPAGDAAILGAAGEVAAYADLSSAIAAWKETDSRIVLLADAAADITLDKNITLDLNSYDLTGSVTGSGVAVCLDSATADFDVNDGVYGSVPETGCFTASEGYLACKEDGLLSFHKVDMEITSVSLRQREMGMYFTAYFAYDQVAAGKIKTFGVVLNATQLPTQQNMTTTSRYSVFTPEAVGAGKGCTVTGTMLTGVLKDQNSADTNSFNAQKVIAGNVYLQTEEGYLFGNVKSVSLKSLLEAADLSWDSLNGKQTASAYAMYDAYEAVMASWKLTNLRTAKALEAQYAQVEKEATVGDIAALEELYAGKQPYQGELHDHAATTGTSDGKQPLEVWKAYMQELDMDFAAIVDHRQTLHMRLPEWDNAIFIGGSEASTHITDREGVDLHYNMTFADPEGLETVLNQFTEFKFRIWSEADREGCGGQMHFNYPSFTGERFTQLCEAVYANGGFLSIVHPKSTGYVENEDPAQAWFADYTGVEVFYTYNTDRKGWQTKANYELWTGMLAAGKKVYATSGNDEHNMPSDKALSTIYAENKDAHDFVQLLRTGNFTAGPVGIRACVGDTPMGGTVDFTGKRLVFCVGDFHKSVYQPDHIYRVDLISDEGVVFSQSISCEEVSYFAVDAQEVGFYRVEVWDTTEGAMLALGNPIWNEK